MQFQEEIIVSKNEQKEDLRLPSCKLGGNNFRYIRGGK